MLEDITRYEVQVTMAIVQNVNLVDVLAEAQTTGHLPEKIENIHTLLRSWLNTADVTWLILDVTLG